MGRGDFVHLHTHSEYSLLDGAARIKDLAKKARELGMPAVALTDHGVMYGAIEFYDTCRAEGVKPIVGCEVYVAPRGRTDRDPQKDKEQYHLVLLAENQAGYRNLLKLVSTASLEGFYYKPRVDRELLAAHSEGLVALSACLGGQIPDLLMKGDTKGARDLAGWHSEVFPGRFYLELQDHGIPEQKPVNEELIVISRELSLPLVATNDLHYFRREDAAAHDVLLCIQTNTTVDDEKRMRFTGKEFYFKDAEEMAALFPGHPEAIRNTLEVAERCNLELNFRTVLPHYEVPPGYTYESYLEKLCRDRIPWRYGESNPALEERLKFELGVIHGKGFSAYFLIVNDFVQYARSRGILAQARGSAAGCLVTYLLGISSVDPIANDLMFESFLRVDGKKFPDIDVDFCDTRRDEVLRYVVEKYGAGNVAQIVTFGTMGPKAAVRDAGRALQVPLADVNRLCKLIPTTPNSPPLDHFLESVAELRAEYESSSQIRQLIDTAKGIEGLCRHASTHAAGVVIAKEPLAGLVPLQRTGDSPIPTTQYDFRVIEQVGLLKMDFLGLSYLTVVETALRLIEQTTGSTLALEEIPLDDARTYAMLSNGDAMGVFQLDSSGMRQLLRELKPREFVDGTNLLGLYRPGPLQSGGTQEFINRRHGRSPVTYPHPLLEPVLKDTYGIVLFQEQVMRIAMVMGGFSSVQAEVLLKAMGKKQQDVMDKNRPLFLEGAKERGVPAKVAEEVFESMAKFARYGFKKAHGAAYALLMYQTAWMKCNYPAQYMAALLTAFMENKDKVVTYVEESRRMGIEVLPPDVNASEVDFAVVPAAGDGRQKTEDGLAAAEAPVAGLPSPVPPGSRHAIRFALSAIKNVSRNAIEQMVQERANGPFRSVFDFCSRIGDTGVVNRASVECLIKAGAFDCTGARRSQCIAVLDQAIAQGQRARKEREIGQFSMLDLLNAGPEEKSPAPATDSLPDVPEFTKENLLAGEKDLLGLYLSDHPVLEYQPAFRRLKALNTQEVAERGDDEIVKVAGIVARTRRMMTRKGDPMMFVTLEDWLGTVEVIVWPKVLLEYGEHLQPDTVILVEGKISSKDTGKDESGEEEAPARRQVEVLADAVRPVRKPSSGGVETALGDAVMEAPANGYAANGNGYSGSGYGNGAAHARPEAAPNGNGNGNGRPNGHGNGHHPPKGDPLIIYVGYGQMRAEIIRGLHQAVLASPGDRRLLLKVEASPGVPYLIECDGCCVASAPEFVGRVEGLLGSGKIQGL